MITRVNAIKNLEKYIGEDLSKLADEFNITKFKDGKQNKGWKGQTLNILAGVGIDNRQAPNGLGFELKSTAFRQVNKIWKPQETMAITMINAEKLIETSFYESHCWDKLKSLVFCAVSWHGKNKSESILLKVQSFDFWKMKICSKKSKMIMNLLEINVQRKVLDH